jgi:hypothetical protein
MIATVVDMCDFRRKRSDIASFADWPGSLAETMTDPATVTNPSEGEQDGSASSTSTADNGEAAGAVTAKYGIPCVY